MHDYKENQNNEINNLLKCLKDYARKIQKTFSTNTSI